MDAITTTLAKIKTCSPCLDGYKKLVKSLGGIKKYARQLAQLHAKLDKAVNAITSIAAPTDSTYG